MPTWILSSSNVSVMHLVFALTMMLRGAMAD